jgi:hypothetical protein
VTKDDLVKLDDIAMEYFDLSVAVAKRKAATLELPVPAFRLSASGRGPYFVTQASLDAYVESKHKAAAKLHQQMASV